MTYGRIGDSELGQIMYNNSSLQANKEQKNNLDLPINFNLLTEIEKKRKRKEKNRKKNFITACWMWSEI